MSIELREVEKIDKDELKNTIKNKLKLLVDTKEKEVHHVRADKHHIEEALKYLEKKLLSRKLKAKDLNVPPKIQEEYYMRLLKEGIKEKDLAKIKPSYIVSVVIDIKDRIIKNVYIGGGSLEKEYNNQTGENLHTMKELESTKKILNEMMNNSYKEVTLIKDISEHEYLIPS